jgi:hypothetical protein
MLCFATCVAFACIAGVVGAAGVLQLLWAATEYRPVVNSVCWTMIECAAYAAGIALAADFGYELAVPTTALVARWSVAAVVAADVFAWATMCMCGRVNASMVVQLALAYISLLYTVIEIVALVFGFTRESIPLCVAAISFGARITLVVIAVVGLPEMLSPTAAPPPPVERARAEAAPPPATLRRSTRRRK